MSKTCLQKTGLQRFSVFNNSVRLTQFFAYFIIAFISLTQPGCGSSTSGTSPSPSVISSVSPVENSTNALVSSDVIVVFVNDMNQATVENSFELTLNNSPVAATVAYNVATKTATLTPSNSLESGVEYVAEISSTVQDSNGNFPLPAGFSWRFNISSGMQLVSSNNSGLTANEDSQSVAIDAIGRYLVFESKATNLDETLSVSPGGPSQVYRKDMLTGEVRLVSSNTTGLIVANSESRNPAISSNGRYVVFESNATNLDASITSPGTFQIYLKDMITGSVILVSRNNLLLPDDSFNAAANASVSDDGQLIVFQSAATNLSSGIASGGIAQVYVKNLGDESIEMISRTVGNIAGNGASTNPDMSPDGTHIVFESEATNLAVTNGFKHIYYVDRSMTHTIEKVSVTTAGLDADASASRASVSDDGLYVSFHTDATNLDALDAGGFTDVYIRNRTPGTSATALVSINSAGDSGGSGDSNEAQISGNTRYIVFESLATNLISNDNNGVKDIFVRDLSTLMTVRVNNPSTGLESTFPINTAFTHQPVISADGNYVGFHSEEKYSTDDTDTLSDVFRAGNSLN